MDQSERLNFTHGTRYAYKRRGCRCSSCQAWRREEARKERWRQHRRRPRTRSMDRGWRHALKPVDWAS